MCFVSRFWSDAALPAPARQSGSNSPRFPATGDGSQRTAGAEGRRGPGRENLFRALGSGSVLVSYSVLMRIVQVVLPGQSPKLCRHGNGEWTADGDRIVRTYTALGSGSVLPAG